MAQEITLPVKLQLENLQAITKEMRTQLSTLKVDSSGYKKLEGVIADIEKRIQALQVASARPLVDKKQFTDVEKEVLHISDDLTKIRIEAGKVKFSDIKLDASQQQKLQEFDNQIKAINESLKQTQARAKEAFLKSDLGQQWSEKHDDAPAQSFQKLTQEIEKEVRTQQRLLKEAEQAQDSYKEKIAAHDRLKAFIKNGGDLKEAKNMLPEVYNSIFRSDGKAFKAGGKNILKQWLTEQFQLDPAFIENLVSQSGEKVQQALSDSSSEIFKKLKQESNRLGTEVGTRKEQAARKENLASNVTQKANDLQTAKAVQGQLNEEELKEQGIQEGLRQQLQQTQAARQNYCSGITEQTRSTLQMGQASEKAQTQLDSLNKTVATGKAKLESIDKATSKLQGISNFVNRYIGAYAIIRRVTQAIRNAFNNIKELDKTITNIAVVTNMSQEQLWSKVGQYTQIAQQYGVMTKDVYTVSQLFYQQGLQTSQVMELTTETLKMAKIAGMDYTAATNAMTVAVRAFNIEMSEAQQVTDTYSALAAKFAVSSAEIANAMEKTASSAANVGMSLQSTSAFMSVMIQTTRESAQNIGSALKSIISRYGEMKASPSSLINVDGEEVAFNKVDTALKSVGISIKDASGQFRDFDDVIMELAAKWNTLDNNTQRYIATVMAGNRQQSRFIALVSNYDELSRAMQVASDSENASIVQVAKTMDSLESKANQLKNAFSQLYLDLHIESGLKGIYDWLTRIITTIGKLGILKGVLPTLANLFGFGTGTKNLISTISKGIQARKLKITADTQEAEAELKRLQENAEKPIVKMVHIETNAQQVEADLNRVGTTITTQLMGATGLSANEAAGKLFNAYKQGDLATDEKRVAFMHEMGIKPENWTGLNSLLTEFNKLASTAETLNIALNTTAEGATNAGTADQQKANAAVAAATANHEEALASQEAAQKNYEEAVASGTAARQEMWGAVLAGKAKQEEYDKTVAVTQAKQDEARTTLDAASKKVVESESALEAAVATKQKADADVENSRETKTNTTTKRENSTAVKDNTNATRSNTAGKRGETGSGGAGETTKEKGKYSATLMRGIGIVTSITRILGTAITAIGASTQDKSIDSVERSKIFTGLGNGLSMAGTGASLGMMTGNPLIAVISAVGGFLLGGLSAIIDGAKMTLAEQIVLQKQEVQKANDDALKTQAKATDLSTQIDNIKQLKKAMYNSTEDMKTYKDAMNTLAQQYPSLINSYDEAGNAIIDLNEAEQTLAQIRLEGARAAREAAITEGNLYTSYDEALNTALELVKNSPGTSTTTTYSGGKRRQIKSDAIVFVDEEGNVIELESKRTVRKTGGRGHSASYTIDYFSAIQEAAEQIFPDISFEDLTYEQLDQVVSKLIETPEIGGQHYGDNIISKQAWQAYHTKYFGTDTSAATGFTYDTTTLDAELIKYPDLFGENATVRSIAGVSEDTPVTAEIFDKAEKIIRKKLAQNTRALSAVRTQTNFAIGQASLYEAADLSTNLSTDKVTQLEQKLVYSKLFDQMLTSVVESNHEYTDILDWYTKDKTGFEQAASVQAQNFLLWYDSLRTEEKEFLENVDFTEYTSADEIASKLSVTKESNQAIYDAICSQFIKSNKANKDRILQTIYTTDNEGRLRLNSDLVGLKKFSTMSYNGSQLEETNDAFKIAALFDANKIISKYSDYFTTQLLDINNLAEEGYTEIAARRLNILNDLAIEISKLDDTAQQSLFGIVTNVNFTDYDSIVDAYEQIEEYRDSNELSEEASKAVQATLDLLDEAKNTLVFNLTTLANTLTDKVLTASKNVDTILSTNKSGLSLNQALEKLNDLQANDSTVSFDQMFQYDATLGKYVYKRAGLIAALNLEEKTLSDNIDKATEIVGYYQEILNKKDQLGFQQGDTKEETLENMKAAAEAAGLDSNILPYFETIVNNFTGTKEEWDNYLNEQLTQAINDEAKAKQILDQYYANEKNTLYAQIDWGKLALGTDYFGTNKTLAEQLASKVLEEGTYTWEQILDAYLDSVYGEGESAAKSAAKAAAMQTIDQEKASNLTTAISEVLNGTVNKYYSDTTKTLLTQAGYETSQLENNLTASITAAVGFLRGMREMIGTGQVTLEQYNEQAKTILDKTLGIYSRGKSGLDFATGTIDSSALQNLANTLGLELTDIVDVATGYIRGEIGKVLSYNSLTNSYEIIADTFEDFIAALEEQFGITIERTSKEYMAALKTYNDNKLKKNIEINNNIVEELEKVMGGKAGDQLNIAYIFSSLSATALHELAHYGLQLQDGILTIGATADIPGAIDYITKQLQEAGALLPEEIAKLNDTLLNYFQNITNLIKNGIGGSLSYENKDELQKWFTGRGGGTLDFTRTANGFKLTQKSAEALYDELVLVDSISAGIVLDELNKSIDASVTGTKNLRHEIEELRATTESEDFKFMDKSIPSGQNNPLNYLGDSGWSKAFEIISEAGANKGLMAYEDFYNIMTEMGNLAELSGDNIQLGAGYFIDNAAKAAELIEQGAQYLTIAADGSVKVDLSKFGTNFLIGSQDMRNSVGEGIKDVADAQIDILDSMIRFLEPLAAMEELSLAGGDDGILDLGEIFNNKIKTEGYTKDYQDAIANIDKAAKDNTAIQTGLENIIVGETNMWAILHKDAEKLEDTEIAAIQAYYKASQSSEFDLSNPASWQQVLAGSGFEGDFIREDGTRIRIRNNVVLETDKDGHIIVDGQTFDDDDAALQAQWLKEHPILALSNEKKEYTDKGELQYTLDEGLSLTVSYQEINKNDGKYTATFADGEQVIADSPEALSTAIRHYALIQDIDLNAEETNTPETQKYTIIHAGMTVDVSYDIETGEMSYHYVNPPEDEESAAIANAIETSGKKMGKTTTYDEEATYTPTMDTSKVKEASEEMIGYADEVQEAFQFKAGIKGLSHAEERNILEEDKAAGSNPKKSTTSNNHRAEKMLLDADKAAGETEAQHKQEEEEKRNKRLREAAANNELIAAQNAVNNQQQQQQLAKQHELNSLFGNILNNGAQSSIQQVFNDIPQIFRKDLLQNLKTVMWGARKPYIAEEYQKALDDWAEHEKELATITKDMPLEEQEAALSRVLDSAESLNKWAQISWSTRAIETDERKAAEKNLDDVYDLWEPVYDKIALMAEEERLVRQAEEAQAIEEGKESVSEQLVKSLEYYLLESTDEKDVYSLAADAYDESEQKTFESQKGQVSWLNEVGDYSWIQGEDGTIIHYKIKVDDEEVEKTEETLEGVETLATTLNNTTITPTLNLNDNATSILNGFLTSLNSVSSNGLEAIIKKAKNPYSERPAGNAAPQMPANRAKGNLALAQGTLMGELGPELVVSNGRYFVAGQNGAEFINLDPDAIVFNHLQTQSLLSRGMSNGRGKALTSEKRSVAYATGNVNGGPAMASAKQALAALKQLRAQWQAIAGMDAKSLANLGGSGGSGGGGSDASDPKAFTKELEKWYNWLQRIAVLEQKITYEEQKRSKIQSDMYAHGQDYAKSHMETLDYLRESAVVSKSLYDSQQEYFNQRRAEMNSASNPFSALYTFDEYGQLKYQNGAFAQLAGLSGRNALTGEANYTAADQYAKLVALGFEKYMQYDSSGNKIDTSSEDWEVTAVQAFWDKMDADKEEMQSLHDSIEEHKKAVLEKQQQANEIMKEIEDNQISVEDKVLKAIIDTREREIDELQKQRDAIEEASNNLINGLSEQLNKEKEMYSSQQNQDELSKLQRQLGILQRSGGSASQIANLQKEISQKQQDAYFDAQQKQIDALQEASDNELERLDNQIELMKETLEYEKENGLLWNQVYEVMAGTPEQITEFIMTHDSEFWGQSPTKDTQTYRETLFEAQQFKAYEGYMKDGFDALVKSFDDFAIAEAARDEEAKANATTSSEVDTGAASSTPTTNSDNGGSSNPTNNSSTPTKSTVTDLTGAILAGLTSGAENVTKASQQIQLKKTLVSGKGILRTYDSGGMIDQDQIALVHAKESVLTPEQTSILRNEILSNKPTSLLSLLTDFRDAYNSIPSASDYNTVNNNDGVTIEQAIVEMHVAKIANDYDAQRAGESALEKMVQIARKTQGQRIGR